MGHSGGEVSCATSASTCPPRRISGAFCPGSAEAAIPPAQTTIPAAANHCRQARATAMTPLLSGPQQPIGVAQHRLTKMRRRIQARALVQNENTEPNSDGSRDAMSTVPECQDGPGMRWWSSMTSVYYLRVFELSGNQGVPNATESCGASGCGQIERGERAPLS